MTAQPLDRDKVAEVDEPSDLSPADRETVEKRRAPPAIVVHEIVRLQGIEELERPLSSLLWSGIAAGVSIWLSLIAEAALTNGLPDTPIRPTIASLGYSVGFIVVILGRLQLFTESTITAVIPLATTFSLANLGRTLRLWIVVLLANFAGSFAVALIAAHIDLFPPQQLAAMIELSARAVDPVPLDAMLHGIPAGFMLATIAWLLPNAKGQEIWIVTLLTYLIALGGFAHVVAGSAEAWLLVVTGHAGFGQVLVGFVLPVLGGNIIGGTGLFAVLAHAQVRSEL